MNSMTDLHHLKRKELQTLVKEAGLKISLNSKNADLIEALLASRAATESAPPSEIVGADIHAHEEEGTVPKEQVCPNQDRMHQVESQLAALTELVTSLTLRLNKLESAEVVCSKCQHQDKEGIDPEMPMTLPRSSSSYILPSPNASMINKSFSHQSLSAWTRKPLQSTPARQTLATNHHSIFKKTNNPFSYDATGARSASPVRSLPGAAATTPAVTMKRLYGSEREPVDATQTAKGHQPLSAWSQWRR